MRRTGLFVAGTLLAATAAVVSPASAHTGVCAGVAAELKLSAGLYYVGVGPSVEVTGSVTTNVGPTCVASVHLVNGNCGNSVGSGNLDDGAGVHSFSVVTAGSMVVVTGGATGVLNATPAPGESCMFPGPGADTFLVTGAVATV